MTAFKRSCALFLAVMMLLAAIPGTVFAAASDNGSTQGSLVETTLDDIASNVAKQVLRGGRDKDDNKIEVDTTEEYDDSDEVEIIRWPLPAWRRRWMPCSAARAMRLPLFPPRP